MAEVLLFHHAQGLTPGVVAFADELRAAGHTVHTPDLFDGRTFGSIPEGMAFINETFVEDPGGYFNPCSQPLTVSVTGTAYVTDYVDQSGNFVRELTTTPQLTGMITGPNGNSLTGLSPAPSHLSLAGDVLTLSFTGQQWRFTLPGSGSVFAIAGNETFVFNLDTGSFTHTFNGESVINAAAYCGYLGAN